MSGVKRSLEFSVVAAALLAAGCSDLQLARFAPPGLVKYEDIASEKPPSAEIQQRISDYDASTASGYPRIADTPSIKDRPRKRPAKQVEAQITGLETTRDAINTDIETSRLEAEAAIEEAEKLAEQRDALSERLELDERAAQEDRKAPEPRPNNQ